MNCPREPIASPAAATKRAAAASASAAALGSTARSARIDAQPDSRASLLLVPPRRDARARGFHRELLTLPRRRPCHIHRIGRYKLALQVDELEYQLVRLIRLLSGVRHEAAHFAARIG